MERILSIPDHPRQLKDSTAPEQDFLSMHFGEHWVSLPVKFNWQPHQIRYLYDGRLFDPSVVCERNAISYEEICIVHFSAKEKPRNFLFEKGRRSKEEFKEWLVAKYLGRDVIPIVTTEQRGNIEKAIDEWFKAWEAAWDMILQSVASCEDRCPACGSQELGYNDPLHCFFTCKVVESLGKVFMAKTQRELKIPSQGVSPMLMLKNLSAFPWALMHVDNVHKKRLQKTLKTLPAPKYNRLTRRMVEDRSPWQAPAQAPRQCSEDAQKSNELGQAVTPPLSHSESSEVDLHNKMQETITVLTQMLDNTAALEPPRKAARHSGPIGAGYRSIPIDARRRLQQTSTTPAHVNRPTPRASMPRITQQNCKRKQDDSTRQQSQLSTGSVWGSQRQKQSPQRSAWDSTSPLDVLQPIGKGRLLQQTSTAETHVILPSSAKCHPRKPMPPTIPPPISPRPPTVPPPKSLFHSTPSLDRPQEEYREEYAQKNSSSSAKCPPRKPTPPTTPPPCSSKDSTPSLNRRQEKYRDDMEHCWWCSCGRTVISSKCACGKVWSDFDNNQGAHSISLI